MNDNRFVWAVCRSTYIGCTYVSTILFIIFVDSFYQFDEKCLTTPITRLYYITYYYYIYIYIHIILCTNKNAITIKS